MHEDEAVLVVDKPVGLPSVAPPGQDVDNAFGFVKEYARDKARRRGVRAWVIHRLDKEASGLLIFAKTETGFHWLKEDFRAKRVHRLYAAVVEGEFPVAPGAHSRRARCRTICTRTSAGSCTAWTRPRGPRA